MGTKRENNCEMVRQRWKFVAFPQMTVSVLGCWADQGCGSQGVTALGEWEIGVHALCIGYCCLLIWFFNNLF